MKRWLMIFIPLVFILAGVLTVSPEPSLAGCVNCHDYAAQSHNGPLYGGYFSTPYNQDYLKTNYSSTNPNSFITKELWLDMSDTGTRWIELGTMKGSAYSGGYWAGHFTASQDYTTYSEYTVGAEYPTGTHNYEIQYVGSNTWKAYVDYTLVHTYTNFTDPYSARMNVGIESDDDGNSFTSGIYNSSLQYKDSGGTWHTWTSANNIDSNDRGWYSTFSSGKVYFYN